MKRYEAWLSWWLDFAQWCVFSSSFFFFPLLLRTWLLPLRWGGRCCRVEGAAATGLRTLRVREAERGKSIPECTAVNAHQPDLRWSDFAGLSGASAIDRQAGKPARCLLEGLFVMLLFLGQPILICLERLDDFRIVVDSFLLNKGFRNVFTSRMVVKLSVQT